MYGSHGIAWLEFLFRQYSIITTTTTCQWHFIEKIFYHDFVHDYRVARVQCNTLFCGQRISISPAWLAASARCTARMQVEIERFALVLPKAKDNKRKYWLQNINIDSKNLHKLDSSTSPICWYFRLSTTMIIMTDR